MSLPYPSAPAQSQSRSVLAIPAFRKLWQAMAFSSFGDWLGLLASTALAQQLAGGDYAKANFAIAGVFIVRLLPAVILGPFAGVIADRFDRRKLMVTCDFLRFALYLSIPIVGNYFWLYTATILAEVVTLFWSPAKEASVPNLVPKTKLESANQVSLLASYGTAPIAALTFSILALFSGAINSILGNTTPASAADIALYINAISFAFCGYTVWRLKEMPAGPGVNSKQLSFGRSLIDGFAFIKDSKVIRGLIFGMIGAFFAAGAVIGLARTFVDDLKAGEAAYGVLFGSVFLGLALGISFGPRVFAQFTRRRLFGASLAISGLLLVTLSLVLNLVLAIFITIILGIFSGITWVTGFTMIGMEVEDEVRGRTFAFVQSLVRVSLVLVLAVSPLIAAAIGKHTYSFRTTSVTYNGAAFTMFFAGLIATLVGILSYRHMRDRPSVSLFSDVKSALRGELGAMTGMSIEGVFISFEGGEGSGKSTQTKLLKEWLEKNNETVLLTREPGGTPLGNQLREILLDNKTGLISPRAEALMYAADRANHVFAKIRPALDKGEIVITDRYFDSSVAYQGAGRVLLPAEVARISRWATESLTPTLTIIMDLPAEIGLARLDSTDRLESEPLAFHERVRQEYLNLANTDPERFMIVDASLAIEQIHEIIIERVGSLKGLKRNQKAT
ncbi:MAG: thymidylate kinase [Actinobacteria bacterium BACL4 MAG-120820-bin23]|jgi:dTMP kinase|nr:MAG: thymidylate kinase [Actinobacteria bacterium BACL4 MAG-120820-bin23]KRO51170.1 MAG: thymidylate kinase [Actinobacteria bacterium BACL4 MAG-121001-bin59]KRO76969.1 MAG: thymidylate kinase [Actinobacteria bacterium BACL4 MAG-120920-bin74]